MAEPSYGGQEQRPLGDVRYWEPERRRVVSLGVLAAAAVLVLGGILLFAVSPASAGAFLWAVIVLLVLLLLFEAAVLATGIAREEGGPPWLTGLEPGQSAHAAGAGAGAGAVDQEHAYADEAGQEAAVAGPAASDPYGAAAAETVEIDLKCPDCQNLFTVEDTGERPLAIDCPHCGAHGHVDLPAPEAQEGGTPAAAPPAASGGSIADEPLEGLDDEPGASAAAGGQEELPSISLKCPSCATQFDVDDTGERPLRTTCPGCGKSGKLRWR